MATPPPLAFVIPTSAPPPSAHSSSPSLVTAQHRPNLIHTLNDPRHALVAREPLLPLERLAITTAALEQGLLEAEHVRRHLRPDASLRAQPRDRDNRSEHAAEQERALRRCDVWVREQRAVVRVEDVDRQVGVRVAELADEFGAVGLVDAVPEAEAALVKRLDVVWFTRISRERKESVRGRRESGRGIRQDRSRLTGAAGSRGRP